jgi:large subunit ribosomal protein L25
LPEYIEIDMLEAKIGDIIHISDVKLPAGVESVALSHGEDHDLPVASVAAPKIEEPEEDEVDVVDSEDEGEEQDTSDE